MLLHYKNKEFKDVSIYTAAAITSYATFYMAKIKSVGPPISITGYTLFILYLRMLYLFFFYFDFTLSSYLLGGGVCFFLFLF